LTLKRYNVYFHYPQRIYHYQPYWKKFMKALKFAIIALMFSIVLPLSNAHATSFFSTYAELYTVGSQGSTTQQTTFTAGQTPWLYVELFPTAPSDPTLVNRSNSFLVQSPTGTTLSKGTSSGNQFWVSYADSTPGLWTVTIDSSGPTSLSRLLVGRTGFQVNAAPEPKGTILFLLGGLIMAISIMLRRKKAIIA
jgi:hypothetical protein